MDKDALAIIIGQSFFASDDSEQNVTDALFKIAYQLKCLGTGDASTTMGAIELLSKEVKEGTTRIADALGSIADAIAAHE